MMIDAHDYSYYYYYQQLLWNDSQLHWLLDDCVGWEEEKCAANTLQQRWWHDDVDDVTLNKAGYYTLRVQ
jgi:hypothetical protein